MNEITYDQRVEVYTDALVTFGERTQMVVALEELSECQKEICKYMRGYGNAEHLAEEIADAAIMLEKPPKFVAWEAEEITSLFVMEENDG